jgi:hypothetical protein
MTTQGIRISDIKNGKCIPLTEVLINISDPNQFKWALLWFDVMPIQHEGRYVSELTEKVNKSEQGLECIFMSLLELSKKSFQEIEVLIIGCKTKENLHRYKDDQKMYETCDIVIEMIDGGFWEIFSKNKVLINQLTQKYKEVEFLNLDFQINNK